MEEQEKKEKVNEVKEDKQEAKTTLKDFLTSLTTKISELEQKLHQQERAINALTEIFKQYQQLIEQTSARQPSSQESLSAILPLILKSLSGDDGGSDKVLKFFIAEMFRTNLLLQRVILQGFAKELGVRLRMKERRRRKSEEQA